MPLLFRRGRFLISAPVLQDDGLKKGFVVVVGSMTAWWAQVKIETHTTLPICWSCR